MRENPFSAAGMSGLGTGTAAGIFFVDRIVQTGIVFIDADESLSDPSLPDQQREVIRTALASTLTFSSRKIVL